MAFDNRLTVKGVATILGTYYQDVYRWCKRLGLVQSPGHHNRISLSVREAVAIGAACTLVGNGNSRLARIAANAILTTNSRWLFVNPDLRLEGGTADELLDKWKAVGSPTGTILDTQVLSLTFGGMEQG